MDQRTLALMQQYEEALLPAPEDFWTWLGRALRAPVADVPTVEQFQREQGEPARSEDWLTRDVGVQGVDWLTRVMALRDLIRGLGTGGEAALELMGKKRGVETFGKEMMDTSRRAYPKKWREMLHEDLDPVERPMRSGHGRILPPGETPAWRRGEMKPADVVEKSTWRSPRMGDVEAYRIGEPVTLPGGQSVQYVVVPSGTGGSVVLDTGAGQRQSLVFSTPSIGEALAKARQLQNRLAWAAKDPELSYAARWDKLTGADRTRRLPWERGGFTDWRSDYYPPPASGRWSGEQ